MLQPLFSSRRISFVTHNKNQHRQIIFLEDLLHTIEACVHKKEAAQKKLYELYYGFALKAVFRYIYRYDMAVDVVNDGFIKFFKTAERFEVRDVANAEKVFMGYLKRIMINTAIDQLRKNKMTPEIGGIPEYVWDIDNNEASAEEMMRYKDLICCIKKLTPQYRSVFNLFVIDGYKHEEIAEILGIPVGTSKSTLSRARKILQEQIKKNEAQQQCII